MEAAILLNSDWWEIPLFNAPFKAVKRAQKKKQI